MQNRQSIIILVAATLVMFYLYGTIDLTKECFSEWDAHKYIAIAKAAPSVDINVPRPFAFRLFGPYLIGLLSIDPTSGFLLFNYSLILLSIILLFLYLVYSGIDQRIAQYAVLFYILNKHFIGFNAWNPYHINDVIMNVLLIVLFWSFQKRKWIIYAFALLVGSATRETFLIILPVTLVFLVERKRLKEEWWKYTMSLVPAMVFLLYIRYSIKPESGMVLLDAFKRYHIIKINSFKGAYHQFVNPFVPFSIIPLIYFRETIRFFRANKYMFLFIVCVFTATLFGLNKERLVHPAFVVFYLLIAKIINSNRLNDKYLLVLVALAFLGSLHYLIGRFPLPSRDITIITSGGSAIAITALGIEYKYGIIQILLSKLQLKRKHNH